jgi:heme oxygenase
VPEHRLAEVREPFSVRLRAETAVRHRQAESEPFVLDLLAGRLPLSAYALLAAQHWFVYEALERIADEHGADPLLAPFLALGLRRLPRLQDDLVHLVGPDWSERIAPLPATRRYVERIQTVAATSAPAFLAHHYTRYLGDLAGGQAVAASLRRTYGLPDSGGTAFYDFAEVGAPPAVRARYRAHLDVAPLDGQAQETVVEEARIAFGCNTAMFADLAAAPRE